MAARDSMLQKLQDSANIRAFNDSITDDERASIVASDLQPDPWRARTTHTTGPDREYLGLDGMNRVVKTPLNVNAMSAHGLTAISDPIRILQILVTEQLEVETNVITTAVIYE